MRQKPEPSRAGQTSVIQRPQRLGHTPFGIAPAAKDLLGELVRAEPLAEDQAGVADDEFEQVHLVLEDLQQVLLKGVLLNEVVDVHRVLLTDVMQAAGALFDLHRIPGQIEVDEAVAELEVAAFGVAVRQEQQAPSTCVAAATSNAVAGQVGDGRGGDPTDQGACRRGGFLSGCGRDTTCCAVGCDEPAVGGPGG